MNKRELQIRDNLMLLMNVLEITYNKKTKVYKVILEQGSLQGDYSFFLRFFIRSNNANLNVRYLDE